MNTRFFFSFLAVALFASASSAAASPPAAGALLDDFSNELESVGGARRVLVDDRELGGRSQAVQSCQDGRLKVEGTLVPGRGMPGFLSLVVFTALDGQPRDLCAFEGICVRVKVIRGTLSVQAGSSAIDNFDYHSSAITARVGEFQDVRIPFASMKRAWSEQTALDLRTITSINIVAFAMARSDFAYELDEVTFY